MQIFTFNNVPVMRFSSSCTIKGNWCSKSLLKALSAFAEQPVYGIFIANHVLL